MRVHRTVVLIALLALTLGQAGPTNAASARLPLSTAPNCPIFPASNVWNRDISRLPVAANSAQLIAAIGLGRGLHPDFSNQGDYGIPFQVVSGRQKKVPVSFDYASESDKGLYPIPAKPLIEGGSDRHMLLIDAGTCTQSAA